MIKGKYKTIDEIPVYELGHRLTLEIYKVTNTFPDSEQFGLTSQLRRSASSIPANIAEGYYKNTTKELIQYLYNARGSVGEMLYHLRLSKDLSYMKEKEYELLKDDYDQVARQINGWINSLKKNSLNH